MSDTPKPGQTRPNPITGGSRKGAAALAAVALAGGASIAEAARRSKVGEQTVRRWLKQPKFRARVNALRGEMVGAAVNTLSQSMTGAAVALERLLKSKSEGTRLRAAQSVLSLATKLRESEELEQRIAELERQFAKGDKS